MRLQSAFFACLMVVLGFTGLALLAETYLSNTQVSIFFMCSALVFLVILPACSTKR